MFILPVHDLMVIQKKKRPGDLGDLGDLGAVEMMELCALDRDCDWDLMISPPTGPTETPMSSQ